MSNLLFTRSARVALLGTAVLLPGCDGLVPCTDAGCGPGVVVELVGAVELEPFVTIADADGEPLQLVCLEASCWLHASIGTPDVVTVTYVDADTTIVREFAPVWRTSHPNGRACSPTCRSTTLRLVID